MVVVEIDKYSGFCFGVTQAVDKAEAILAQKGKLYCLGSIVHNEQEVLRLQKLGLKVIDNHDYKSISNEQVLFRAHGEPPVRYENAKKQDITIVDATCPVVLKLQQRVRKAYDEACRTNGQVLIFGKKGHAEVIGLQGQTNYNAVVIQSEADFNEIDFDKIIYLFSQTTQSVEMFEQLSQTIKAKATKKVYVYDTICRQVADRAPRLAEFVKKYDTIIFVGGKQSSNGKYLFDICKHNNANSHFVSEVSELKTEWFAQSCRVGVCGATSTPRWQMEQITEAVSKIGRGSNGIL